MRKRLVEEFGYKNPMEVPKLDKIVINMGVGEAAGDQKKLDAAVAELMAIAGQKPVKTIAKKAIAGFKIREGQAIGCKVTLRKARMYEFLDRLVTIALPRVRDFRGIPGNRGFDGRGNFAMGLKEQIVFPEINYDTRGHDPRDGHPVRHHGEDRQGSEGAAEGLRPALRQLNPFGKPPGVSRGRFRRTLRRHGQDLVSREEQPARAALEAARPEARRAQGGGDGPRPARSRSASRRR